MLYKTKIFENLGIYRNLNGYEYKELEKTLSVLNYCNKNLIDRLIMLEYINSNQILKNIDKNKKYEYYCENIKKLSIINNLKYSNKITNYFNEVMEYMINDSEKTDKVTIKKYLSKIGYDKLSNIFNLKLIYNTFFNNEEKIKILNKCIENLNEIENLKEFYTIKDLDIDGKVLINLGYKGKEIGDILEFLLDNVIKKPSLNNKDILINLLKL